MIAGYSPAILRPCTWPRQWKSDCGGDGRGPPCRTECRRGPYPSCWSCLGGRFLAFSSRASLLRTCSFCS